MRAMPKLIWTKALSGRARRLAGPVLAAALVAACSDLNVPDLNNPSLEDLLGENPTADAISTATTGLLIGARNNINAYVNLLGIVGRESYNLDPADPRYVDEMLAGALDPGSGAFGGNLWTLRYRNIADGNIVLNALDRLSTGMSAQEKEAVRGFTKTMQALDYLLVINTRDANGAVILPQGFKLSDPLPPISTKEQVFAHINKLLDEGAQHLQAGGTRFPFAISSGFADFKTPAAFLQFNRGLKARTAVYQRDYAAALTALNASFLDRGKPLSYGVYHVYSPGAGDATNSLFDPNATKILVQPEVVQRAARNASGQIVDQRALQKIDTVTARTYKEITSNLGFRVYNSIDAPVPVIRNEELILLRAEARWFTGDKLGALNDLNFVRQTSGGLAPTTLTAAASDAAFVDALLYERLFSLLYEGGHRWIDARRFGRLNTLPAVQSGFKVPAAFPIPEAETLAR